MACRWRFLSPKKMLVFIFLVLWFGTSFLGTRWRSERKSDASYIMPQTKRLGDAVFFAIPEPNNPINASESRNQPLAIPTGDSEYDAIIHRRMFSYQTKCQTKQTYESVFYKQKPVIMADNDWRLGYCFVAKIGCPFWLRILSYLTRRDQMKQLGIKTPFDIDRSLLHTGQLAPMIRWCIDDFEKGAKLTTKRFFFTRNPFDRLWSVYLDKYYLIDYWVTNPIASTQCGTNVTFQQFLDVAVTSSDHHLVPIVTACEPCRFKPDYIGKMETFTRDSRIILKSVGYNDLIDNYDHSLYVDTELKSLIVYNFKAMKYPIFAKEHCLFPKDLCRRMWRVFQMNGLIKKSVDFPENLLDYSEKYAIEMFLETVHRNPITKGESKTQRREAIAKAYSEIKWNTIQAIQHRYKDDIEMFDYDLDPPKLDL